MSLTLRAAAVMVGVLVLASPASAQVSARLNEIGFTSIVDVGNSGGADEQKWSVDLTMLYGRFLTERWEVGPEMSFFVAQDSELDGDYGGFAAYHFGDTTKALVPYAQASVGSYFGDEDGNAWFLSVGPGLKWFVGGGRGALNVVTFYRRAFYDKDRRGISGDNGFGFTVGASLFFKTN